MRVRIVNRPTGLINGVEWPPAGGEIDLPQATAEGMAAVGDVEIVVQKSSAPKARVEKRPAPKARVEQRGKADA